MAALPLSSAEYAAGSAAAAVGEGCDTAAKPLVSIRCGPSVLAVLILIFVSCVVESVHAVERSVRVWKSCPVLNLFVERASHGPQSWPSVHAAL